MAKLFEAAGLEKGAPRPLADRLRPKRLAEVVGQDHLVGADGTLTRMLKSGRLQSMILWGPPGTRQDHDRAPAGGRDRARVRAALGHLLGRAGPAQGLRPRASAGARPARARCCSSTRSIASTARSRTASCRTWRTAPSRWSAPPPRTRPSSSTARCCRARWCWCSTASTRRRWRSCWRAPRPRRAGRCRSMPRRATALHGHGRRRRPHRAQHGRGDLRRRGAGAAAARRAQALTKLVQRRAPLYDKIARRPLQPDQRAAQVGARLRPRRGALLAGAHARRRRGPALHRAPAGAHGDRGHRPRRSAGGGAGAGGQGRLRLPGHARRASWRWRRPSIYLATAPKSNAAYMAFGAAMRAAKETAAWRRPSTSSTRRRG